MPTAGTRRLSGAPGNQGNAKSYEPQMSADGRTVAFTSLASNLVSGDTNGVADIFTADSLTGAITRASVNSAGLGGERGSYAPTVSPDGQKVAFYSDAANLAGGNPDTSVAWGTGHLMTPHKTVSHSTTVTLEAWFNTTTGGPIFGMANHVPPGTEFLQAYVPLVYVGTDGRLRGTYWQMPQITSAATVNDGQWHHVVLAANANVQKLFLDGLPVGTSYGTVDHLNMDWMLVGAAYGSGWPAATPGWSTFNGRIDEPAVYWSYLPDARVAAHYASRAGDAPGGYAPAVEADSPVVWWRFNDVSPPPLQAGHPNAFAYDAYGVGRGIWISYQQLQYNRHGALTVDSNTFADVYLRQGATTTLLSKGMGGAPANGHSLWPQFSPDGRYLTFMSNASNLVAGDTNGLYDTFLLDTVTGAVERVSVGTGGVQANNHSYTGRTSAGGRYVTFYSAASNLSAGDTNGALDVFVRDRTAGTTTRVSVGPGGVTGNGDSAVADISADGNTIVYYSAASNLVAGDTNNALDIFLYDRPSATTTKVSTAGAGAAANSSSFYPRISADGRHVVYATMASNLVAQDANGHELDVVSYDRWSGLTRLVSGGPSGASVANTDNEWYLPAVSADGSRVVFDSKGAVVGTDTNNLRDVYFTDRNVASADGGLGEVLADLGVTAGSDGSGLEQFYPYRRTSLGTGNAYVNLANGNLVARFDGQVVPAQGLNLVIGHTYNSNRAGGLLGLGAMDSGLGPGWNLSVSDLDAGVDVGGALGDVAGSLGNLDVGAAVHSVLATVGGVTGQVLDFVDTDGTAHRFVRTGGPCSRWDPPPGVSLRVAEEYDGGALAAYRLVRPDGVTYRATPVGLEWRVTSVSDRRGNSLTYKWEPRGLGGNRLTEVRHSRDDERLAELTYNGLTGRLQKIVTLPDNTGTDPATNEPWARTTTFTYELGPGLLDLGNLVAVTQPGPQAGVQPFAQPGAQTTTFAYPAGRFEVTDGLGHKTTVELGTTTPGAPRVTRLTDRANGVWEYDVPASTTGAHVSTVTTPVGDVWAYEVSALAAVGGGDLRRAGNNITKVTDPGTGGGPVSTSYTWTANRLTKSTDSAGNDRLMAYDDLGLLVAVTEPPPNDPARTDLPANAPKVPVRHELTYEYSSQYKDCTGSSPGRCFTTGQLTRTVLAADVAGQQRVTDFAYYPEGELEKVTQRATAAGTDHPDDRTTTFAYYTSGALRTVDGPLDNPQAGPRDVTTFGNDDAQDPYGGYDRTGMPTRITDGLGNYKTFEYTPYGLVSRLEDRDRRVSVNAYSVRDKLLAGTGPDGKVTEYRYDANDQLVEQFSPMGKSVRTAYDAMGRATSVTGPGTVVTSTQWRLDGAKAKEVNPLGGATDFAYHPNQSLKWADEPANGATKARTEHLYDSAGRLAQVVSPETNTAGDRPVESVTYTPQGAIATRSHTAPGTGDATTRYAYDAHGAEVQSKGPRHQDGVDAETTTEYSTFGEVLASRRRLDATKTLDTLTTYDKAGNRASVSQPTGDGGQLKTDYAFDVLGQMVGQLNDPSNPNHTVTYTYSGEGQQLTRVDRGAGAAPLRTTAYTYNPDNTRASMVATDHTTGATLATCNTGYDDYGNLEVTRTVLGAHGCTVLEGDLEVRTLTMGYDARNFITSATQTVRLPEDMRPAGSAGEVTRAQISTYDDAGNQRSVTLSDGTTSRTTTYEYDEVSGSGRLLAVVDWRGGRSTNTYFTSGSARAQSAGTTATATYEHRRDGSPESLVWTAGGQAVRSHSAIAYDVGGLRAQEVVSVVHPAGAPPGQPTGGTATFANDLVGRLTSWKNPFTGAAAPTVTYTLDDGGNITAEGDGAGVEDDVTSAYTAGKLTSRTANGTTVTSFTYDDLGQETARTTAVNGTPAPTRTVTTYGPAGHTAKVAELDVATGAGVGWARYLYDSTDRLVARTEMKDGATTATLYFYWGSGGALAEEADHTGATKALYLVDPDGEAIAQHTAATAGALDAWAWLLSDAGGNVATLVDDTGAVTEQKAYDPYGKPDPKGSARADASKPKPTLGFQGHIEDPKSGSVVLGARLYDPTTQRFTTPDTFVAAGLDMALGTDPLTGNRYLYAAANPVGFYDDGHWPSPAKLLKKVAKAALPAISMVPYVGAGIEVVSLATGRDLLDGGRKMDAKERLVRTGMLAAGAIVGVSAAKAVTKVLDKVGEAKKANKATEALGTAAKAERKAPQAIAGADDAASIISSTARGQSARGAQALQGYLSPAEQAAYAANPARGSRFLGQGVHRATRDALDEAYPGRFIYRTRGVDFVDTWTGEMIELTTPGQVASHMARPGYRGASYATYWLP